MMFSAEAECAVLGALLQDNDAYDRVASIIAAADFAIDAHRMIYQAIECLVLHKMPADPITVSQDLDERGQLEYVGGLQAIGDIMRGTAISRNAHRYAETVRDYARERAVLCAINDAHGVLHGTGETAEKIAQAAEMVVTAAETGRKELNVSTAREVSAKVLQSILKRSEAGQEEGLDIGFVDLQRQTGKLKAGQLIIVAGRPGMGKSTLARNIAENIARHQGVLFVSLEMEADELGECFVSSLGHADYDAVLSGNTEGDHALTITAGATKLGELKLSISTGADTVPAIHALARTESRKLGSIGLIVVDYLQQLRVPGVNDRRVEIDTISRGLKRLAMTLHCPVIALAQLSRSVEQRSDKRPMLSDLRESGGIEADADKVIFLYRDEYYNADSQYKGLAEAIVAKNRRGKTGKVPMAFIGDQSRFADVAPGYRFDDAPAERTKKVSGGFC